MSVSMPCAGGPGIAPESLKAWLPVQGGQQRINTHSRKPHLAITPCSLKRKSPILVVEAQCNPRSTASNGHMLWDVLDLWVSTETDTQVGHRSEQ